MIAKQSVQLSAEFLGSKQQRSAATFQYFRFVKAVHGNIAGGSGGMTVGEPSPQRLSDIFDKDDVFTLAPICQRAQIGCLTKQMDKYHRAGARSRSRLNAFQRSQSRVGINVGKPRGETAKQRNVW